MRVNADRGDAHLTKFAWKRWAASGKDWKIWAYALIFGSVTTVSYALAYFLPIILNLGLGFDTGTSQCLIAPPYAFAGIMVSSYSAYSGIIANLRKLDARNRLVG